MTLPGVVTNVSSTGPLVRVAATDYSAAPTVIGRIVDGRCD